MKKFSCLLFILVTCLFSCIIAMEKPMPGSASQENSSVNVQQEGLFSRLLRPAYAWFFQKIGLQNQLHQGESFQLEFDIAVPQPMAKNSEINKKDTAS